MEKRYYSANEFYREKFGKKLIKISIDAGFTCPNRDGSLSKDGCIFCSARGSGDFAPNREKTITQQFYEMKKIMDRKWKDGVYMPYFQAFTNTYAPVEILRKRFYEAISLPEAAALSIATRPDCLEDDKINLIRELNSIKYTCVELGLQTSDEKSARLINRCFDNSAFVNAVKRLEGIDVTAHIILGLPGETKEDMLKSVKFAADCGIKGIKLQLLHVLKNTALEDMYNKGKVKLPSFEEYVDLVVSCIEILPKDTVIHRITGDGKGSELIAPLYSKNKKKVLNAINREFIIRNTFQGSKAKA